jgi:hypothetical protein
MAKKKEEQMYTIRQAAEVTGASVTSLRIWLANDEQRKKRFPNARKESSPIGEFWVIPESDIQSYQNQGRGRPQKPDSELKNKRRKSSAKANSQ